MRISRKPMPCLIFLSSFHTNTKWNAGYVKDTLTSIYERKRERERVRARVCVRVCVSERDRKECVFATESKREVWSRKCNFWAASTAKWPLASLSPSSLCYNCLTHTLSRSFSFTHTHTHTHKHLCQHSSRNKNIRCNICVDCSRCCLKIVVFEYLTANL